jgi:hypothetical protein
MDFSDSDSDSGRVDLDRLHEKKMKKLDLQRKNWGKNRQDYYNSDTQYFEVEKDEDAVRAEEKEIKLIQQEQAALMTKMDFGLDALLGPKKSKATSTTTTSSTTTSSSSKTSKLSKNSKNSKTILSVEDRVLQVLQTSPELLAFLSTYLTYSQELSAVLPLMTSNLALLKTYIEISPIVSLLKLRQQLLLGFCTCILYYLYLKSMNKNTSDHPVMSKLLTFQTLIEAQKDDFGSIKETLIDVNAKFITPFTEYNNNAIKKRSSAHLNQDYENDDKYDDETPAEYYKRIAGQSAAQKKARIEYHDRPKSKKAQIGSNIIDDDLRRGIGNKIQSNVGLRRQKSKKQIKHSTTRGKLRKKHDTAIKKRKTQVREFKGSQGINYSGEATIKKGVIRSVKL